VAAKFAQPKCWWQVEEADTQQQQQQQQVAPLSGSQHVVKLMANRVSVWVIWLVGFCDSS
jgi:hypothetical protein